MAGIGDILSGASSLGALFYSMYRDSSLSGAEREQNTWNAAQAEKQMNFQSSQAEIARDWQERMYNQYNSPHALVSQYRQAGINPALMFGGSTPSAPQTTSVPSGAMASGSFGAASRINAVDAISRLGLLAAQIDNMRADTANKRADTTGKEIVNEWNPKLLEQQWRKGNLEIRSLDAGIDHLLAQIDNVLSDTGNKKAQRRLMNLQAALLETQNKVATQQGYEIAARNVEQTWRNTFKDKFGYYPGVTLRDAFMEVSYREGATPDAVRSEIQRMSDDGTLGLKGWLDRAFGW